MESLVSKNSWLISLTILITLFKSILNYYFLNEFQVILDFVSCLLIILVSLICSSLIIKKNIIILISVIFFYLLIGVSLSNFYYIAAVVDIMFCFTVYCLFTALKSYDIFLQAWSRNININIFLVIFPCVFILFFSESIWVGQRYSDVTFFLGSLSSFALLTIPTLQHNFNSSNFSQTSFKSGWFSLLRNSLLIFTFFLANARAFMLIAFLIALPKKRGAAFSLIIFTLLGILFFSQEIFNFFFTRNLSFVPTGQTNIPRLFEIFFILDSMSSYSYLIGNGLGSLADNPFYDLIPNVPVLVSNFHNSFLEIFYKFGFFALSLYVFFLYKCYRNTESFNEAIFIIGYLIMSISHSRFSANGYDLLIHTLLIFIFLRQKNETHNNYRSIKSEE